MTRTADALSTRYTEIVADVILIFAFSDLEYPIGPKLDSFASLFLELIIFNTYLVSHALVKIQHFSKIQHQTHGRSFLMPS